MKGAGKPLAFTDERRIRLHRAHRGLPGGTLVSIYVGDLRSCLHQAERADEIAALQREVAILRSCIKEAAHILVSGT